MTDLHKNLALLAATQETLVELGKIKDIVDTLPDKNTPVGETPTENAAMAAVLKTVVELRAVLLDVICRDDVMRSTGGMYALASAASATAERPGPL
jgi:hypothetical protein